MKLAQPEGRAALSLYSISFDVYSLYKKGYSDAIKRFERYS